MGSSRADFLAEGALGYQPEMPLHRACPTLHLQLSDRHGLEEQQDGQLARERNLQLHEGALPLLQGEGPQPGVGVLELLQPLPHTARTWDWPQAKLGHCLRSLVTSIDPWTCAFTHTRAKTSRRRGGI